jgi:hypothetical protein
LFTSGNICKISHLALDNTDLVYPQGKPAKSPTWRQPTLTLFISGNTCNISHLALDNIDLVYPREYLSNAKWEIFQVFPGVNKVSVV